MRKVQKTIGTFYRGSSVYTKRFQYQQIIKKYTLEIIKSCNTMNIAASSMKHMFLIIPVYLSIYTSMEMQYCTERNTECIQSSLVKCQV